MIYAQVAFEAHAFASFEDAVDAPKWEDLDDNDREIW